MSRSTNTRSHGTRTWSKWITASFSSKREANGLSNTLPALCSYDLRDSTFRPGVASGSANEMA